MSRFEGFGPDTFRFLQALGFHQNREWFAENRTLYDAQLREPLLAFCAEGAERARNSGVDVVFDAKKGPFRINRDVRFSNDKSPYNQHVSAVMSPDGSKKSFGVLYVHVGLERQFLAAGFWALPKDELNLFRRSVLTHPERYMAVLADLARHDLALDEENALKRLPRGWDDPGDNVLAHALRLRGFTVSRDLEQRDVHSRVMLDRFAEFARAVAPLMVWGRRILE